MKREEGNGEEWRTSAGKEMATVLGS